MPQQSGKAVGQTVAAMKEIIGRIGDHRGDRPADEPAGPERGHRGRPRRRAWQGIRRRGRRGAQAGRAQPDGRSRDRRPVGPQHRGVRKGRRACWNAWCPTSSRTAELVQEISAASREQATGADQISIAIQQLDLVIQQNASSSEEMAAAAQELLAQAEGLDASLTFFRIDDPERPGWRPKGAPLARIRAGGGAAPPGREVRPQGGPGTFGRWLPLPPGRQRRIVDDRTAGEWQGEGRGRRKRQGQRQGAWQERGRQCRGETPGKGDSRGRGINNRAG